ncbi:MAG: tetratricopeptide repeat protein [Rhodobacteraceae bacterium]|jgi:tetratricopeptide (TPR) repeat protein|nr:tetratricopeptide repeat protein [Paracoccaceae bacterium]
MPRPARRFGIAAALALAVLAAPHARAEDGLAGAYLAARSASGSSDYEAAAQYYTMALVLDPSNAVLMESAAISQVALGRLDLAVPVARRLREVAPGNQMAELVLLASDLAAVEYAAVAEGYAGDRSVGPLVDGLIRAWVQLALGNAGEALTLFDALISDPALAPFGAYHKALALALVGDFEGAEALFSGEGGAEFAPTRRGVVAHVEVLTQLERYDDALAQIDRAFGADPDPTVQALRARVESRQSMPFDLIASPRDGLAEVFFTVAGALAGEADDSYTLVYARLAEALSPSHTDAVLLSASILERQEQFDLATAAYNSIGRDDPAFHLAELGRAEALRSSGKTEAAIEVLTQLARTHPDLPDVQRALGDILRAEERFDEAVAAYDAAIAALPGENPSHWVLYYVRGISHERGKRWEQAERDFRKALELSPDQPQVLNYLGYSYLEMDQNLDEALGMIERAVEQRPDDGYIVDSLAWALYRLGRYEEAVAPMERAAALMPVDPIVNDHLGDVYWAVGRRNEAEFQWRRALSFGPEDEDATRIRRKLEVGLDVVLAEEGEKPVAVANDGG